MSRIICLFLTLVASNAFAGDYLLEIEKVVTTSVKQRDRPASKKTETVRSIATLCRLGETFRVRSAFGSESLFAAGELTKTANGTLRLHIRVTETLDSGYSIELKNGKQKPLLTRRKTDTQIVITPNVPLEIGRIDSHVTNGDAAQTQKSNTVHTVVTLTKFVLRNGQEAARGTEVSREGQSIRKHRRGGLGRAITDRPIGPRIRRRSGDDPTENKKGGQPGEPRRERCLHCGNVTHPGEQHDGRYSDLRWQQAVACRRGGRSGSIRRRFRTIHGKPPLRPRRDSKDR